MNQKTRGANAVKAAAPSLFTLVIAASVGPLAMNVFLPSLPNMAAHFKVSYATTQLLVSLYLVALAVTQLFIGPASDRFGRRPVMLICFAIFIAATIAAIYAPTMQVLLAIRVLQAFSAAGVVLSRAIVRDTVGAEDAASRIGYITMGMSVTPMIAPFIGGHLDELYGWQSTFWLTAALASVALVFLYFDLRETNHNRSVSIAAQFRSYPELLGSRRFWGYSMIATFTSGVFFAFLGGGPFVATEILGLSPSRYGLYFGIISLGYMLGNFIAGRFSRTVGLNRMMLAGNLVNCAGIVICYVLFQAGFVHALSLFAPAGLIGVGNGMTMPNANAGMVSVKPRLAGSASGLGGALTMAGSALLAAAGGAMLSVQSGPYPMLLIMFGSSIVSTLTSIFVLRRERSVGKLP